ncbi:MAG: hypothetical protein IT443_02055 [Phycisphaeraceae bacterium]|nr:hypothetical protein [Phycisphaeraceae bacterium]
MPGSVQPPAQPGGTDSLPGASSPIFQRLDLCERRPYRTREYLGRYLWLLVQATLIRYSPPQALGWRRFWLRLFGAQLAPTAKLRARTRVMHPWLLSVGHHSSLASGVNVYNLGPIHIGDHTTISQGVELCAGTHDYRQPHLPLLRLPIHIGSGVWICAQAFIGPNVTVGDNTIVGARAVVMKDLPPNVIAAGNPAVVVRPRPMNQP